MRHTPTLANTPRAGPRASAAAVRCGSDLQDLALLTQAFGLPAAEAGSLWPLVDGARLVRCPPGPLALASPRRPEPSWWLVSAGRLLLGADGVAGEIGPGQWLDVGGAQSAPGTWLHAAVCLGEVSLMALPLGTLYQSCADHPALARACGQVQATALRALASPAATARDLLA